MKFYAYIYTARFHNLTLRKPRIRHFLISIPPLPANLGRLQGAGEERGVVGADEVPAAVDVAELEEAHRLGNDDLELQAGELLANAAVAAGAEGQVRRVSALADEAVSVVNSFLFLGNVADNGGGVGGIGVPAVGIPLVGVREEGRVAGGDAGCGQEGVRGRNDIVCAGNGHGRLDGTQDRVDRGMEAESLLDDGEVKRELGKGLVGQGREVGTKGLDLLLVEVFHDLRVLGEATHDPGRSGRRRVLTSHEQRNHHVGNLVVGNLGAVLVARVHQVLHDVKLLVVGVRTALLDGIHVDLGDSLLGMVTPAVPGKRGPVKSEVDGGEAHVEVVVESSEGGIKLLADSAALEGMRGREDGNLGHVLGDVGDAGLALEVGALLEVGGNLVGDDGYVGAEGLGGQGNLHELQARGRVSEMCQIATRVRIRVIRTFFCSISLALGQS